MKAAGALAPESIVKMDLSALRDEIESRKHATRPTRRPADEMRIFPLVTVHLIRGSWNENPINSGMVYSTTEVVP
jgi:hypothetical protein